MFNLFELPVDEKKSSANMQRNCLRMRNKAFACTTIATEVETRLKVGMLYGGYHVVANTSWSRPNHSQVHIEKLLYVADTFVAGNTIFWHCVKSWENKSKLDI